MCLSAQVVRTMGSAAAVALVLVCATSCNGTVEGAPPEVEGPPPLTEGQRRMIEELDRVAKEAAESNPYLGRARGRELREQLATVPEGQPDMRLWLFSRLLAEHELALGNVDEALRYYEQAYAQLPLWQGEMPPNEATRTIFDLAVAYMRKGETQNCVQHHTPESCILPIRGGGRHVRREASTAAVRYFGEVLERSPRGSYYWLKAVWLLNLAHMTLDQWPDGVPEPWRIAPAVFESEEPFPRFLEIAPDLGLNTFDLAGGAVADDFDGDGLLDLVVTTSDTRGQMRFHRNAGDGSFTDGTERAGLTGLRGGLNLVNADYDNDGDVDLLVLRGAWWRANGRHPKSLLQNDGKGRFTDVTLEAGLWDSRWPTQTAAFGDYDNDGDLDFYVGNEYGIRPGWSNELEGVEAPCELYRNNGNGTFTDVAAQAGVQNLRYAKSVSWGDYDNDRDLDLYVSNLGSENRLYRNNGDGTFTDVAPQAGVTTPISSFPSWFWDFDNDGALDLFVSAYGGVQLPPDVAFFVASYLGFPHKGELPSLYRGDGRGGFTDVARQQNLNRVSLPMGSNFGDVDNDGWLDFYLGTGYPYYEGLVPNVMYRNRGGTGFSDVTTAGGLGHLQKGHGVVFADLDNDGDQDIFEQIGGFYPGDAFGNALFANPGFGNHWIKIALEGARSNRAGFGARIRIDVTDGGVARSIHRVVGTGGSFGGNPRRQEIGLGRATRIDRLTVYWPTSDTTQVFLDLPADRAIVIAEDRPELREQPHAPAPFRRAAGSGG